MQDNPVLLLPWLLMGLLVMFLEAFLFASRLFYEGIHMNRSELLFTGERGSFLHANQDTEPYPAPLPPPGFVCISLGMLHVPVMMVHNWLQVFCLFNRQVRMCEY